LTTAVLLNFFSKSFIYFPKHSAPTAAFTLANPRNSRHVKRNRFSPKSQGQRQHLLFQKTRKVFFLLDSLL
jgi:hypothetical protein